MSAGGYLYRRQSPPRSLLGLPPEVRLKIYAAFEYPDLLERPVDGIGDNTIRPTRKALMLSCRTIYAEWAPTFFLTSRNLLLHKALPLPIVDESTVAATENSEKRERLQVQASCLVQALRQRNDDHRQRNYENVFFDITGRYAVFNFEQIHRCLVLKKARAITTIMGNDPGVLFRAQKVEFDEAVMLDYEDDLFSIRESIGWPACDRVSQDEDEMALLRNAWASVMRDRPWVRLMESYVRWRGVRRDWSLQRNIEVVMSKYTNDDGCDEFFSRIKHIQVTLRAPRTPHRHAKTREKSRTVVKYFAKDGGNLIGLFQTEHSYFRYAG
jgi:hypothetical protein